MLEECLLSVVDSHTNLMVCIDVVDQALTWHRAACSVE